MEGSTVRFRMRDSANGNRKKVALLAAGEFIGRFMQHVMPAALEAPAPDPVVVESVEAFMRRVAGIEWSNCPHCREGRFVVIEAIPPSPLPRPPPQGPP